MAGNKGNTKTKSKDDKSKSNRNTSPANEEEETDFSILRKPIHTTVTSFAQARKVFDTATEEVRGLLSNECDILYECKVCRSIFRSLANFISHKRMYCKDTFDSSVHGHFVRNLSAAGELSRIKKLEELCKVAANDEDRIPVTKDLTEIVERLTAAKGNPLKNDPPEVTLQSIPKCNVAVFQNIKVKDTDEADMQAQVKELNNMMSKKIAVLRSDGTFEVQSSLPPKSKEESKKIENVIQISDDEEVKEDGLKCTICDLLFSTQKTLKFHMKYKHLNSRLVHPCPDCLEIFSTSWSVYRHLFKVHRKTAAQIRRLRDSIQAKAFRMDNPPASYERRKNNTKNTTPQKITEEERLDQENQAWIDNLEGDGEVPRCGGCGRTFERRAALAAHTHTCQTRSRALSRRPPDARKIEIQIRKDYNKPTPPPITLPLKISDSNDVKQVNEDVSVPSKLHGEKENETTEKEKNKKDTQDKMCVNSIGKQTPEDLQKNINKSNVGIDEIKLPYAHQVEISNYNAFSKQCSTDADIDKLLCKKCDSTFSVVTELYEHMAEHYKWLRYACKLCNFKHYKFEKLPEHVKVVHKLKGDTDFYFSTVKAIDGAEALQLSECLKDTNESNDNSPNSRRPSRCSSDSSRLSDDSSSSSTRTDGARKRKMKPIKTKVKKKKDSTVNDDSECSNDRIDENDSSSNVKTFEENSSDIEDVAEKSVKKSEDKSAITSISRRPVRKRTYKMNDDFEYDLSNLLKKEAQGYRDSQIVVAPKPVSTKKKNVVEVQNNNEICNKNCIGAMVTLTKKAVSVSAAHMRCSDRYFQSDSRATNIFLRPLLPKVVRVEKISPKKDTPIQVADSPSPNKNDGQDDNAIKSDQTNFKDRLNDISKDTKPIQHIEDKQPSKTDDIESNKEAVSAKEVVVPSINNSIVPTLTVPKSKAPLKLCPPNLDVIKNPLVRQNIKDFAIAGMTTKIVVIKPLNKKKDEGGTLNIPPKLQTIKFKESIVTNNKEKSLDQVRIVQLPKVDCAIKLPVANNSCVKNDTTPLIIKPINTTPPMSAIDNEKTLDKNDNKSENKTDDVTNNLQNITEKESSSTENLNWTEEHLLDDDDILTNES